MVWSVRGEYQTRPDGSWSKQGEFGFKFRPLPTVNIEIGPEYQHEFVSAQWVRAVTDPAAVEMYGRRYVFAGLDQTEISFTTRLDLILSPRMSLQMYLQPLMSVGTYTGFKEAARPRTYDFLRYGQDTGTITYNQEGGAYLVYPGPGGTGNPFLIPNPDFNFTSLRANTVFRWEFKPGSTLYVVWTQEREDETSDGAAGVQLGYLPHDARAGRQRVHGEDELLVRAVGARQAETLPVLLERVALIVRVLEVAANALVDAREVVLEGSAPIGPHVLLQILQQRPHPSHHLDRCRPAIADLVERQHDQVVPGGHGHDEPQTPVGVAHAADVQVAPTHPQEEVLDLVERLHGGRRVVDRGRQRLDGDVHQEPDRVLRVLLERPIGPELDRPPEPLGRRRRAGAVDPQDRHPVHHGVADGDRHDDDEVASARERHQRLGAHGLHDEGPAVMRERDEHRRAVRIRRLRQTRARARSPPSRPPGTCGR